MHPFRAAIEARDVDAAVALLADDVVFRSPVVFEPYCGREAVAPLLHGISRVFEYWRCLREIGADDASDHALVFEARIGTRLIEGCDFLHTGQDGLIDEFFVMVRPLSAALALAEAMKAELADLGRGSRPPCASSPTSRPNRLQWREAPEPDLGSDRAALVKPLAVATCDLDAIIVSGRSPFAPPFALGHRCVGEVSLVGDAVTSLAPGPQSPARRYSWSAGQDRVRSDSIPPV